MGFHNHPARHYIAFLIILLSNHANAQWREWTDIETAVEDLTEAVRERCEVTFTGYSSNLVATCEGGQIVSNWVSLRGYAKKLGYASGDSPISFVSQQRATGHGLVISGYQTDRWIEVVGGVSNVVMAVYTNYVTGDFSVLTNSDCVTFTSEWVSVVYTSAPAPYLPSRYIEDLDSTIADLGFPEDPWWNLYDATIFDPSAVSGTSWWWTVRNQWEVDRYSYADPKMITHSQLCARAGLPVTNYVVGVYDRGSNWPRIVTNTINFGWEDGNTSVHYYDPPKAISVTVEPRYVTNLITRGLWLYAVSNDLRTASVDGAGNTQWVGRILGTLTSVRDANIDDQSYRPCFEARGFGSGADGIYQPSDDPLTWNNTKFWLVPLGGWSYIVDRPPIFPDDYYHPYTNALWASADADGFPAGCYYPLAITNQSVMMATTGDVSPVARLVFRDGENNWGENTLFFTPEAANAYLWVTHNSTNDRWCSGATEPSLFPAPLQVRVVGSFLRGASSTQGPLRVTITQTVSVATIGRFDLAYPLTDVISITASNPAYGNLYSGYARDGIEITARLGDYTEARSIIGGGFRTDIYFLTSGRPEYIPSLACLKDRRKLLSAMSGLTVIRSPIGSTNASIGYVSTNAYWGDCKDCVHQDEVPPDCSTAPELMPQEGSMDKNPLQIWWISKSCMIKDDSDEHSLNIFISDGDYHNEYKEERSDWGKSVDSRHEEFEASCTGLGPISDRISVNLKSLVRVSSIHPGEPPRDSGPPNAKVSRLTGDNVIKLIETEDGCSIDVVDETASNDVYVIRGSGYRVEELYKLHEDAVPVVSGTMWMLTPSAVEWPKNRYEFENTQISYSGYDSKTVVCSTTYDPGDGSGELRTMTTTTSQSEGVSMNEFGTVNHDGYILVGHVAILPAYRYP